METEKIPSKGKASEEKAKKRLLKERTKLLLSRPFFGVLALQMDFVPEWGIKTMSVDGKYIYFNPNFVLERPATALQTFIAHEVLHCALGHLWRQGSREHEKWNYAADYAVNIILYREGFDVPKDCLCEEKYEGMEAERIYAKLGEEKKKLLDSHDRWPGKKSKSDGKKEGEKKGDDGSEKSGEKKDEPPKKNDAEQKVDAKGLEEEKKLEKRWKEKLVQAEATARMRGKLPGFAEKYIEDMLEPKLDWRAILRDLIATSTKNDFQLMPPNKKHLWRGMYLPSLKGESIEIAFAVDSSASITADEFQIFLAELRGIMEQFESYVIHFFIADAEIHFTAIITGEDEWPLSLPKQNGGTNFIPVFKALEETGLSPSVLIYLTDGDGLYPEYPPEYPVIWVLNHEHEVPFGATIHIEV